MPQSASGTWTFGARRHGRPEHDETGDRRGADVTGRAGGACGGACADVDRLGHDLAPESRDRERLDRALGRGRGSLLRGRGCGRGAHAQHRPVGREGERPAARRLGRGRDLAAAAGRAAGHRHLRDGGGGGDWPAVGSPGAAAAMPTTPTASASTAMTRAPLTGVQGSVAPRGRPARRAGRRPRGAGRRRRVAGTARPPSSRAAPRPRRPRSRRRRSRAPAGRGDSRTSAGASRRRPPSARSRGATWPPPRPGRARARRASGRRGCRRRRRRSREDPGGDAEEDREGDRPAAHATRSQTAMPASRTENAPVNALFETRCWSDVPASAPATAGRPTSAAYPGRTSPRRP